VLCPRTGCGGKTRVVKTWHEDGNVIRKRQCGGCDYEFTTTEKQAVRGWIEPGKLSTWDTVSRKVGT